MSMKKYNIKTTDVELLKKWYYLMTLGRALDEKAPAYLLQSLGWSFHAPYAGHDGIQLAIGQVFTKGEDFLFPYYRDMLTALSAGMTAEELILNGISKATDPGSGGRHMSNHFAKPEWHIENISSATGTHDLHRSRCVAMLLMPDGQEYHIRQSVSIRAGKFLPALMRFPENIPFHSADSKIWSSCRLIPPKRISRLSVV